MELTKSAYLNTIEKKNIEDILGCEVKFSITDLGVVSIGLINNDKTIIFENIGNISTYDTPRKNKKKT